MSTTTKKPVTFTPTEIEILLHRLGVPDALADCLEEEFGWSETEQCANDLHRTLSRNDATKWEVRTWNKLEMAILKDCCDGSTFFGGTGAEDAVATGEISRGTLLNWQKAAKSLEAKFASIGVKVSIPNY